MWRGLQYGLLAGYFALTALLYPKLPARFPRHFNGAGNADGWAGKSLTAWFALPVIAVLTIAFMGWVTRLASSNPNLWNVPEKQKFLALTPEQRRPIVQLMSSFITGVNCAIIILFISMQYAMYQVATGRESALPLHTRLAIAGTIAGILFGSVWFTIKVRREVLKASRSG